MATQLKRVNDFEEEATAKESPTTVGTNVQDRFVNSYRPKKWQSNVTILSCVRLYPKPTTLHSVRLLTSLVYRKL